MQCCYRDRLDIIALILDIANGNEVKQADILIKANIPYTLFREYLLSLYQSDLIEIKYMHLQRTYRTTTKGLRLLDVCNEMRALITRL